MTQENLLEKVVSLCKRKGFVYPSSDIYGGLSGFYDYGPLGAELLRNLRNLWWKQTVQDREDVYGLDGAIILHPRVWEASGHVVGFDDPLIDCKDCKGRVRVDKLGDWRTKKSDQGVWEVLERGSTKCPLCEGELIPEIKQFNLLMKTELGSVEGSKETSYLKGESCQNLYLNYQLVVDSFSPKLPFGIAQIGKAFRNEITTGKFIFKTREFEQWDVEYYVHPDNEEKAYQQWKKFRWDWFVDSLGVQESNLRWRQHTEDELIFYAKDAWDIEYQFPFGWDELEGLHNRTDYDLTQHSQFSGKDLSFTTENGEKIIPYVIEASGGLNRTFLVVLLDAYREEGEGKKKRVWLELKPALAPYKVAVFPLMANKPKLVGKAREVFELLQPEFHTAWDDRGNVGKRYYSQDEIGTPWCVTIDYQTLEDETVTIRDRDTTKQARLAISELPTYISQQLQV